MKWREGGKGVASVVRRALPTSTFLKARKGERVVKINGGNSLDSLFGHRERRGQTPTRVPGAKYRPGVVGTRGRKPGESNTQPPELGWG